MQTGINFSGAYIPQLGKQFSLKAPDITLKGLNGIIRESPPARTWIVSTDNSFRTLSLAVPSGQFEKSN